MDSVSQLALGAAVGVAVMGRRTAVWKAALWGGVCGTLPDLDVLVDHGDAVSNMTLHRADSHALFWLTLAALPIAAAVARLHGEWAQWRRWWLALWLALVTHPLLDAMTVYGTQIARPFSSEPVGVGSIFIIDPLYTLPLLIGVVAALAWRSPRGQRWNAAGLLLSTAYLGWSFAAQQHVAALARTALAAQGVAVQRLLVTPTAFNTVLWRVVAVDDGGGFHEGFHSLFDSPAPLQFDRFDRGQALHDALATHPPVARIAWFSRGFYKLSQQGDQVLISDLRMGQEPYFTFAFAVAEQRGDRLVPVAVTGNAGRRPDIPNALRWLWRRAGGERLPPPR